MGKGITPSWAGVQTLCVLNNTLIAGGEFDSAGGVYAKGIAQWSLTNEPISLNSDLSIFPNPSQGVFAMLLLKNNSSWSVEVYDILGKKIFTRSQIIYPTFNLDISSQPDGVYFYKVVTDNGALIGEGKLVIEK